MTEPISSTDDNGTIQGLWVGDDLTTMERLALMSFLVNGHKFVLYTYRNLRDLPEGVVIGDANEVLLESSIFKYGNSEGYAVCADLFRYKLLVDRGGWWADLDIVCVRRFDFDAKYVFATERDVRGRAVVTNCVLKVPCGCRSTKRGIEVLSNRKAAETTVGCHRPQFASFIDLAVDSGTILPRTCSVLPHWSDAMGVLAFTRSPKVESPRTHTRCISGMNYGEDTPLIKTLNMLPYPLYEQLKTQYLL